MELGLVSESPLVVLVPFCDAAADSIPDLGAVAMALAVRPSSGALFQSCAKLKGPSPCPGPNAGVGPEPGPGGGGGPIGTGPLAIAVTGGNGPRANPLLKSTGPAMPLPVAAPCRNGLIGLA